MGEKEEETEVDLWMLAVGAGVDGGEPATELCSRRRRRAAAAAGGGDAGVSVPPMVQYETRYYTQRLDHFNSAPASYATFQASSSGTS